MEVRVDGSKPIELVESLESEIGKLERNSFREREFEASIASARQLSLILKQEMA